MTGGLSLFPFSDEPLSITEDFNLNLLNSLFEARTFQLAFPDNDDSPSLRLQLAPDLLVPFLIPSNLRCPEVGVGLGHRVELAAFVPVPEATVDEDDSAVPGKDDVWCPRQTFIVDTVTEPKTPESVAQFQRMLDTVININPRNWLLTDTIPSLGEARGKMVLMRRYEDEAGLGEGAGIPLLWPGQKGYQDTSLNTTAVDNGSYTLWVQDRFEYNSEDKWEAFIDGLEQNGAEKGDIALHFLSTKGTAAYGHPYAFAKDLNQRFFKTELPEGERIGWIVLDFVSAELAAHIYETNF